QPLGVDLLLVDGCIGRATAHGEVVTADHDPPARDSACSYDAVGRHEALQSTLLVRGEAGKRAVLFKAARVQQAVDPLADRQPPTRMLAGDGVGPAHRARKLLAVARLIQLRLPGHRVDYRGRSRAWIRRFCPASDRRNCIVRSSPGTATRHRTWEWSM